MYGESGAVPFASIAASSMNALYASAMRCPSVPCAPLADSTIWRVRSELRSSSAVNIP
jgi:hypothetical protein